MADIVLAIGTSHSPLLNSPPEDYPKHVAIDASGRKLLDKNGRPSTYCELLEKAAPSIKQQIEPQVLELCCSRYSVRDGPNLNFWVSLLLAGFLRTALRATKSPAERGVS